MNYQPLDNWAAGRGNCYAFNEQNRVQLNSTQTMAISWVNKTADSWQTGNDTYIHYCVSDGYIFSRISITRCSLKTSKSPQSEISIRVVEIFELRINL